MYTDIYVWDVDHSEWANIGGLSGGSGGMVKGTLAGTAGVYTCDIDGYTLSDGDIIVVLTTETIIGASTLSINGSDAIEVSDMVGSYLTIGEGTWLPLLYNEVGEYFQSLLTPSRLATATGSDPAVTDDETIGILVGDHWINGTSNEVFMCTDASEGAAVWTSLTAGGTESDPPVCGSSTFNGYATGRVITHDFGTTDYDVAVMPSADPSGLIGQVWYTKSADTVAIKCSGTATTAFDYRITKWPS